MGLGSSHTCLGACRDHGPASWVTYEVCCGPGEMRAPSGWVWGRGGSSAQVAGGVQLLLGRGESGAIRSAGSRGQCPNTDGRSSCAAAPAPVQPLRDQGWRPRVSCLPRTPLH